MKKRKEKRNRLAAAVAAVALWANIAVAALYLLSAYIGYADPEWCGYLSLLPLAFPLLLALTVAGLLPWAFFRRRNLLVSGVALAATIPQIWAFAPLNFAPADAAADFRLMTYNVHSMSATPTGDTGVDEIERFDPDFVCMQEMRDLRNMDWVFADSEAWKTLRRRYPYMERDERSSTGFFSKEKAETVLSRTDSVYFCYAVYRTTAAGKPAYVVNMHLESIGLNTDDKQLYMQLTSPDDSHRSLRGVRSRLLSKLRNAAEARARQAREVRSCIDSLQAANPGASVFVCGDFNDTPYSYSYLTVRGDFSDAFSDGATRPAVSYNMNRFYFRIDQIFYHSDWLEAYNARRGESRASDHYSIIADFRRR